MLVISDTKRYESFPVDQFRISKCASALRLDCDQHGGGIMVFTREDIPEKVLSADTKPIQAIYTELNFHKRKWLLSCSRNPSKNNIMNHLDELRRSIDLYSSEYEHVMLL